LATDPQSLLAAAKCFECFTSASSEQLIELQLWSQILTGVNAVAATDPQSLFTQSKCYLCMGVSQFQALKLALLAQISLAHNAANAVDPQSLMTQGKCWPCFSSADTGQIMELSLLAQIAT
jgi:hypothetical protein